MKVAIIQYSTWGHVTVLAREIKKGVEETGLATQVDIFQVPETLPAEVLTKMYAPPKPTDIPVITNDILLEYDAYLFGVPTRFGTSPAQWNEFIGQTGGLWATGKLVGKPAGIFVSTAGQGGGQEATVKNFLSYLAHHGMPFVPLGYGKAFPLLSNLDEPHGGSPWGAGSFSNSDGSRQPSVLELGIAKEQGESFARIASKFAETAVSAAPAAKASAAPAAAAKAPVTKAAKPAARQAQATIDEKEQESGCKCVIM